MGSTPKKGGKARRPSAISRRTKRSKDKKSEKVGRSRKPAREKPTPIADEARAFLYECSRGMDENEKRDKFLERAKSEETGGDLTDTVRNVVRAALFQGEACGRGNPLMRKKKKCGSLDAADKNVLFILLEEIGVGISERLGVHDDNEDEHVDTLVNVLKDLDENFDHEGGDADHWKDELTQLASDILDCVLGRARERLESLMGASAWKEMGLPQL